MNMCSEANIRLSHKAYYSQGIVFHFFLVPCNNEDFEQITDELWGTNYKDTSLQKGTTYEYRIIGVGTDKSQTLSNVTAEQTHQDEPTLIPSLQLNS